MNRKKGTHRKVRVVRIPLADADPDWMRKMRTPEQWERFRTLMQHYHDLSEWMREMEEVLGPKRM